MTNHDMKIPFDFYSGQPLDVGDNLDVDNITVRPSSYLRLLVLNKV